MNAENNLFSSFIYKKADLVLLTRMVFTHQTFEQIIAYFLRHWMFISQRSGDSCKQHSQLYCISFTLLKNNIFYKSYTTVYRTNDAFTPYVCRKVDLLAHKLDVLVITSTFLNCCTALANEPDEDCVITTSRAFMESL